LETSNQEIELRLVIVGDDQRGVAKEISQLERWENYSFADAGTRRIHDVYFDTADGALAKQNFGIRIRALDSSVFITIKGEPELLKNGSVRRLEMEQPWSDSAGEMVRQFFRERKIVAPVDALNWQQQNPARLFEQMGLQVIHERFNDRRLKNIVIVGNPKAILVEMAIDEMTFPLGGRKLKLFEIELEQKEAGGERVVAKLKKYFLEKFHNRMLLWAYSKLATGIALQKFITDREFQKTIDSKNQLQRRSYELIERHFQSLGRGIN